MKLTKEQLTVLIDKNYSIRNMTPILNCSVTNIRYWLKKYNLKTNSLWSIKNKKLKDARLTGNVTCCKCNITKPTNEFYKKKDRKSNLYSWCKSCFNLRCSALIVEKKKKAIEYKGGKCVDCNNQFEYYLYDFHHLEPKTKSYNWNIARRQTWERTKQELDKCVLLCCMCHRIREYKSGGPAVHSSTEPIDYFQDTLLSVSCKESIALSKS